jgi:hypothetical protein
MTTFPAVIDKLIEVFRAQLPEYTVNDGAAPPYDASFDGLYTEINVGWSPDADAAVSEIAPEGLAASARESYNVRCTINAYIGDMDMKISRDQAMKVWYECRDAIRGINWNREVPGVLRVYVGLVSYDAGFNEGAAIASVQFNVSVDGLENRGGA